jgi:peroxiredoxin
VRVTVLDPTGKPAAGARLFDFMSYAYPSIKKADGWYSDSTKPMVQNFTDCGTAGVDGTVTLKYDDFCRAQIPAGAYFPEKNWIGFINASPATLCHGTLTVQLQPQRLLRGKLQREVTLGNNWAASYLYAFGNQCAFCEVPNGDLQFPVAPGDYEIYAYGSETQARTVKVTVPAGDGDFVIPPVILEAKRIVSLVGKPPPAFDKVVDWKNGPVQVSDFKGKLVLLYFWNYKQDPAQLAELMALQDKYKDKGLQVIAVHNDPGGTVNTAKKLDAKTKKFLDGIWEHDIQFPVAIYFSKMNQPDPVLDAWGVTRLPASMVIDRKGNVAKFTDRISGNLELDLSKDSEADATIAKLLNEP